MDGIYTYIETHSTRQGDALMWVEERTKAIAEHPNMLSGAVQGQFLRMVAQMCGARRILEIGTFTGYSAICMASALPEGGRLDTLEICREYEDTIREGFARAALSDVIRLHIGEWKESVYALRREAERDGWLYDMVFIDADKREYCEYYQEIFGIVRPGGIILADNALRKGRVCSEPEDQDEKTRAISCFNDAVAADPRVESVILPLRDGINIIRKNDSRLRRGV